MSLFQYRVFYATCLVVSLLFISQVVLGRIVQVGGQELSYLEQGIQHGQQSYARWQQLAGRTYQLSQSDPGLKDVVVRQQITVKPPAAASPTASSPATTPTLSNTTPKSSTTNE